MRKKTIKKRKTPEADYERFARGFADQYRNQLDNNPSERNFQKLLRDYNGHTSSVLQNETRERTEKYLGINIVKTSRESSRQKIKREREYKTIGYVKTQQVYVYDDYYENKKTHKKIRVYRDSKGRFAKVQK